ncbi:MAG: hypothetical protein ACXW1S_03055 [Acidimicrobiia bacterium]
MFETLSAPVAAEVWYFWLAPLFLFSFLGVLGLLALGYYQRVVKVKRGR